MTNAAISPTDGERIARDLWEATQRDSAFAMLTALQQMARLEEKKYFIVSYPANNTQLYAKT